MNGVLCADLLCLDAISAANPRVIDDARARKLSNDLKRCTYYETCATYGLNVERVFQDGKHPWFYAETNFARLFFTVNEDPVLKFYDMYSVLPLALDISINLNVVYVYMIIVYV